MTINATAPILLALYVAAAEAPGRRRARPSAARPRTTSSRSTSPAGTYIFPPRPSMRLVTDVFEFCAAELPQVEHDLDLGLPHARGRRDGRPGAGLHARRRDRLRRGRRRARPRRRRLRRAPVASSSPPGRELFEEVAKFRVARRMWATIMRERFGATNPRSLVCRFHVQTAGSSLTAQSVDNNVVRTTIQALAAVLGGAQSLHTNSRDEALALPTEEAARLALRTQQIIAYEAGVTETPDPLAGSLLRREPDQRARGRGLGLPRRDRGDGRDAGGHRGRLPAAPDPGGRLPRPAGDRVAATRSSSGSTASATTRCTTPPLHRIDPDGERRQIERVRRVRAERSAEAWTAAMDRLEAIARGRRQPDAGDPRRRPRLRDGRRDQRPAARRLGRAPRADHGLTAERDPPATVPAAARRPRRAPRAGLTRRANGQRRARPRPRSSSRSARRPTRRSSGAG